MLQPIISMLKRVRVGLTESMTWRQLSTVASKNSLERFFGLGPYQESGLNDPAMSTQQRAPTASARAQRSTTYSRFWRRFSLSGSSMFFHAPTSAMITFWDAKDFWMARMSSGFFS